MNRFEQTSPQRGRARRIALAAALITGLAPASARAADRGLEAAIGRGHAAIGAILKGDPQPLEALFADRADITLGSPFGPYARGPADVDRALRAAAANYRDGAMIGTDRLALYADGAMATVVEIEHDRTRVGGAEAQSMFDLRVTSVFQRIDGKWRMLHRHADRMTSAKPVEAVLGRQPVH